MNKNIIRITLITFVVATATFAGLFFTAKSELNKAKQTLSEAEKAYDDEFKKLDAEMTNQNQTREKLTEAILYFSQFLYL